MASLVARPAQSQKFEGSARMTIRWNLACGSVFVAAVLFTVPSCKSDDGDGSGGAGGDAGGGGGGNASGGSGGRANGGAGGIIGGAGGLASGGAGGMAGGMAGAGGMEPPPFTLEVGTAITTPGILPIDINFALPADLTKFKAFQKGDVAVATHDTTMGGRLKFAADKQAALFFDTTPDDTGSNGFTEFTASIKFQSTGQASVYLLLSGDNKRSDARLVSFTINNGVAGPPGVTDVDSLNANMDCSPQYWKVETIQNLCQSPMGSAYAFLAPEAGDKIYTLEVTTKKVSDTSLTVYAAIFQGDTFIDHQIYTYTGMKQVIGEVGFGGFAKGGDLFLDDFKVTAPKAIPDLKILEHVGADAVVWNLWLPENTPAIKGLLHFSPSMAIGAGKSGEYSLFEAFRKFARANSWGLITNQGAATVASLDLALPALATASAHAEVATVPLFVESLISSFANDFAATHPEKTIGFFENKLSTANLAAAKKPAGATDPFLAVPGIFTYAPLSVISSLGGSSTQFKAGRELGAQWAMAAHGGQTHAVVDSSAFYLPFAQELIDARLLNGAGPLLPAPKAMGYLGEHKPLFATTQSDVAVVAPYGAADDLMKSWLLNADVAKIFSAFHYNRMMGQLFLPRRAHMMSMPLHGKAGETRAVTIGFQTGFMWEKIEFFDGGTKVGEVAKTQMPTFTYPALAKGAHSLLAQVTGMDGLIYMTMPVLVVMEPAL